MGRVGSGREDGGREGGKCRRGGRCGLGVVFEELEEVFSGLFDTEFKQCDGCEDADFSGRVFFEGLAEGFDHLFFALEPSLGADAFESGRFFHQAEGACGVGACIIVGMLEGASEDGDGFDIADASEGFGGVGGDKAVFERRSEPRDRTGITNPSERPSDGGADEWLFGLEGGEQVGDDLGIADFSEGHGGVCDDFGIFVSEIFGDLCEKRITSDADHGDRSSLSDRAIRIFFGEFFKRFECSFDLSLSQKLSSIRTHQRIVVLEVGDQFLFGGALVL